MRNKEKVYQLDDIGFIGVEGKQSASSKAYHKKKTGEAIRELKNAAKKGTTKTRPLAAHD